MPQAPGPLALTEEQSTRPKMIVEGKCLGSKGFADHLRMPFAAIHMAFFIH